jgi:hypothetical protein
MVRVSAQVEHYFSDRNFHRDLHLQSLTTDTSAVFVHDLLGFSRIQQMVSKGGIVDGPEQTTAICSSLAKSDLLDVVKLDHPDGKTGPVPALRRKTLTVRVRRLMEAFLSVRSHSLSFLSLFALN